MTRAWYSDVVQCKPARMSGFCNVVKVWPKLTCWLWETALQKPLVHACSFALHSIRKIRPFLKFLSRRLSFLGWITAMLLWLDFQHAQSNLSKGFRMQQHATPSMSSTYPKRSTSHFIFMHCLAVAAHIKYKTLMLAYRTATGFAPSYFHPTNLHPLQRPEIYKCNASYCTNTQVDFRHRKWNFYKTGVKGLYMSLYLKLAHLMSHIYWLV